MKHDRLDICLLAFAASCLAASAAVFASLLML
jgi:hypothetical protein